MAEAPTPPDNSHSPYCGNCGYSLVGLTDSPRCPECGKPLVEVLQRASHLVGRRYTSQTRAFGLPLISLAIGPHGNEKRGHARGIIAIGDIATGWLAIGGIARGIFALGWIAIGAVAFGGFSLGLLLVVGGFAIGGVTNGGFALGGYAHGGFVAGVIAEGGMSFGYYARGGMANGQYVISAQRQDPEARDLFSATELTIGGRTLYVFSKVHVYALFAACLLAIVLLFTVIIATRGSPPRT